MINPGRIFAAAAIAAALLVSVESASAQIAKKSIVAPEEKALENGFQVRLLPAATINEMQKQEQLFEMEVTFKSMRLRWVELTDPKTGEKKRELIWYLVYRAVNRPLNRPEDTTMRKPVNTHDDPPTPTFIPRFMLLTQRSENGATRSYRDSIIPEALKVINKRESRYEGQPSLKHNVAISGPVPAVTPAGAAKENAVYGVAMWRDVDPQADYVSVAISGFSNAYIEKGGLTYRKMILMKFKRPGDEFFQSEAEFDRIDADDRNDSKSYYPRWIYVPDDTPPEKIPQKNEPVGNGKKKS